MIHNYSPINVIISFLLMCVNLNFAIGHMTVNKQTIHIASYKIIVTDAVLLIKGNNKNNQKKIKTCVEFSEKFITTLKGLVNGYEEVRVVFDNYHEVSFMSSTF